MVNDMLKTIEFFFFVGLFALLAVEAFDFLTSEHVVTAISPFFNY